jgi:hypothetical protein
MCTPKPLPEEAVSRLPLEMKRAKTKDEFQRPQYVWLRTSSGLSSKQVATTLGWHLCSPRIVQAHYLKAGEVSLKGAGRGGHRRQNLTFPPEEELLQKFLAFSGNGGILEVILICI